MHGVLGVGREALRHVAEGSEVAVGTCPVGTYTELTDVGSGVERRMGRERHSPAPYKHRAAVALHNPTARDQGTERIEHGDGANPPIREDAGDLRARLIEAYWVLMWRPIEVLVYDSIPWRRTRRVRRRLLAMPIEVRSGERPPGTT